MISRAPLDSRRFGVEVYRVTVTDPAVLEQTLRFPETTRVDLMIARVAVERMSLVQALEAAGYFLTDTLIYWAGPAERFDPPPASPGLSVRDAVEADRPALEDVARAAFTNFGGHYHTDPRIDSAAATEGYVEWCLSALADRAGGALVAEVEGRLAGFLTMRRHDDGRGEIVLNGVSPAFQRRGIYDALVRVAGHRFREAGLATVFSSTQLHNLAPQRVWARRGMEPTESLHTFHRWYA